MTIQVCLILCMANGTTGDSILVYKVLKRGEIHCGGTGLAIILNKLTRRQNIQIDKEPRPKSAEWLTCMSTDRCVDQ